MATGFRNLTVYKKAFALAMDNYHVSKKFPKDELYSLTTQIRKSSRSVCSNIGEGYRKRLYEAHFVSKISDCETEAAETQVWLEFATKCEYLERDDAAVLYKAYDEIIGTLVGMINHPATWTIKPPPK